MIFKILRSTPIAVFFTFLFVFGAPITNVPLNTSKIALLVSLIVFFLMVITNCLRGNFKLAPRPLYFSLFLSSLLVCYSALLATVKQTHDFSLTYNLFILVFENILGSYVFYRVFMKGKTSSQFLDIFVWIGLIQSIVIIVMFVDPAIREFVFYWFANEQIVEMSERYGGIRGFGIAGSVTYDFSVLLSVIMIFTSYQLCNSSQSQRFYIFAWVLGFLSIMMTGRTGFLGIFISLLLIFYFLRKKQSLLGVNQLVVISIVAISACFIFLQDIWIQVVEVIIPYAFEMFFSAFEGKGLSTNSTDLLYKMYFPIEESTLFFGDAMWRGNSGGYYMHTDAGYMRHVLFYGVIGSAILYFLYIYAFVCSFNLCDKRWRFFILAITGYFFVVHAKGDFLVGSSMNIKIFFLLFSFLILKRKQYRV